MFSALQIDRKRLVEGLFLVITFVVYTAMNIGSVQNKHPEFSYAESVAAGAATAAGPLLAGLALFVPLVLFARLMGNRFKVPKEELENPYSGAHMWVMLLWTVGISLTALIAEIAIFAIARAYT